MLNFFFLNPELQLQDTESAIRNKIKDLLTEFVMTFVLKFKKIESNKEIK